MLFNSYEFILLFLPLCFTLYFFVGRFSIAILLIFSLFYYSFWHPQDLFLFAGSLLINFTFGSLLLKKKNPLLFYSALICNLLFLGYYKYSAFIAENCNAFFGLHLPCYSSTLPLAISFFTFQQIAYLVDCYRSEVSEYKLANYCLFVSFFPQLIAGPIVHHKEMMPQFEKKGAKKMHPQLIACGLFLFSIGLFKKIAIADGMANWASAGFDRASSLSLFEGWFTSLSYSMQLYFDFSGYTDMATGCALLFNIELPQNFNSPYKASNIQDFWKRWHMTLSRFLRDYIYIPLGGNRKGTGKTCCNLLLTFIIGGIWHGAGWLFVLWGALHGVAMIVHRLWQKVPFTLPKVLAWFLTFQFINITWIFFRASSWKDALKVLRAMFGFEGISVPTSLLKTFPTLANWGLVGKEELFLASTGEFQIKLALKLFLVLGIALFCKNSNQLVQDFQPNWKTAVVCGLLATYGITNLQSISEFIYFQF